MDVSKYSYTGLNSSNLSSRLTAQRAQLDDLTLQETSQLKSQSYAGIDNASLVLAFQRKIATNTAYQSTITNLNTRLDTISNCIDSMQEVSSEIGSGLGTDTFALTSSGQTASQTAAKNALETYVATLNTDVNGTYVFGGKESETSPVVDVDTMLNGDGTRAGYEQVAAERLAADLGTDDLAHLTIPSASGSTVTLSEDGATGFGMKLGTVTNDLSGVTVTDPSGTPASSTITVASQPTSGQTLAFDLTLPDGTTTTVTLTAGTENDTSTGTFAIGSTTDDTAANIQAALKAQIQTAAKTDLTAASAVKAADQFFDTPQQRVDSSGSVPTLVDATSANTVSWYRGTDDSNSARSDAQSVIDDGLTVNYGVRANEGAFTSQLKALAVISTLDVSGGTDDDKACYQAAIDRVGGSLTDQSGSDSLQTVAAEIGGVQSAASSASDRLTAISNTYQTTVDSALVADQTTVAVQLASLQTNLEASYKASSILYKLSITDYL